MRDYVEFFDCKFPGIFYCKKIVLIVINLFELPSDILGICVFMFSASLVLLSRFRLFTGIIVTWSKKDGEYGYNIVIVVLMTEVLKLICSTVFYCRE